MVFLACSISSLLAQLCWDPLLSPAVRCLHGVSVAGMSVKDKLPWKEMLQKAYLNTTNHLKFKPS